METLRADFDKIAVLESDGWNHNNYYHPYLLKHVAIPCDESLDIGCGIGTFSRLLARRSRHNLGLDLSPEMVRIARDRSAGFTNLDYQVADVLEWIFPKEKFDCIASIATLHHLPFDSLLERMKSAIKPGGVLLILDLFEAENLSDLFLNTTAFPANLIMSLVTSRRLRPPRAQRLAWAEHGTHDHYLKVSAVRSICQNILPEAVIQKHLFWRYSLVWHMPVV